MCFTKKMHIIFIQISPLYNVIQLCNIITKVIGLMPLKSDYLFDSSCVFLNNLLVILLQPHCNLQTWGLVLYVCELNKGNSGYKYNIHQQQNENEKGNTVINGWCHYRTCRHIGSSTVRFTGRLFTFGGDLGSSTQLVLNRIVLTPLSGYCHHQSSM